MVTGAAEETSSCSSIRAFATCLPTGGSSTSRQAKGGNGRGSKKHGADGDDVEVRVPVGTQLLDADDRLIADLTAPDGRHVVARGGPGRTWQRALRDSHSADAALRGDRPARATSSSSSFGSSSSSTPRSPASRTPGKSSLLRRISNAKPKVADYPFTTLEPVLGVVDGPDERQLTVADIPGLIEGAADGAGLGHQFLAHLERARLLVHVIDASEPDLEERFRTIDGELEAYGAGLAERPQLVVLNKVDLLERAPAFTVDDARVVGVVATSCATGAGSTS